MDTDAADADPAAAADITNAATTAPPTRTNLARSRVSPQPAAWILIGFPSRRRGGQATAALLQLKRDCREGAEEPWRERNR
jgi:hypothetical protein